MRKFIAIIDDYGKSDIGFSGLTVSGQDLVKGKIYYEHETDIPENKNHVIDEDGNWWLIGSDGFKKRFKEIK